MTKIVAIIRWAIWVVWLVVIWHHAHWSVALMLTLAALDILAQEDCWNEAVPTVQRKRDISTVVVPIAGEEA